MMTTTHILRRSHEKNSQSSAETGAAGKAVQLRTRVIPGLLWRIIEEIETAFAFDPAANGMIGKSSR
jgi:hypothetical protein